MANTLYQRTLGIAAFLVPPVNERLPVTWENDFLLSFIPFLPFFVMCYLVRRPNTQLLRLAILPIALAINIRLTFAYQWPEKEFITLNFGRGLGCLTLIARSIEFALARNGRKKVGEVTVGVPAPASVVDKKAASGEKDALADKQAVEEEKSVVPAPATKKSTFSGFSDAVEMCFAVRGIGWDFGTGSGLYVASTSRNVKNRSQFLFQTLTSAFQYYLSVDLLNTFLKLIPGVGTPEGGSIYISILPPAQRALMAFMITFTTGLLVPGLLGLGYDIGTFFAVLVLRHDPAAWPPLFDKPWGRTSIHAHWARGWHNLLRQTFFILGGFPFQAFLGRVGLEFGTFFGSALYHYLAMYSIGRTDLRVLVFFTAQFFGMRLEKWWRRSTGYAVGGPLGFLWLFVWMTGTGQIYSEALMTAGVGGGTIIPSWLSIGQRWALPYMKAALTNTFPVLFPPLAA